MWEVWIVGHDEMRESRVEHAMMVVIDSAATVGVIGKHEKERVRNRRKAPRVRVRTAIGIVDKDEVGDLDTSHGVLTGYIMDESEFSLWPVKNIVQEEGAEYIQTKHKAVLKHADGRIDEYVRHNDLWVLLKYYDSIHVRP